MLGKRLHTLCTLRPHETSTLAYSAGALLTDTLNSPRTQVLRQPAALSSDTSGQLHVTLTLSVLDVNLRGGIAFRTRAYNAAIPGPTLSVFPGDVLHITLHNNLGGGSVNGDGIEPPDTIPCSPDNCTDLLGSRFRLPNTTNLHTHGLHVSSAIGADNVLDVVVGPGETSVYKIHIPEDHMGGIFWYHPHLEGSSALQVTGGAAGAIIVQDPPGRGLPKWVRAMPETTLVLQQIACSLLRGVSSYAGDDSVFQVQNPAGLPADWAQTAKENNQHGKGIDPSSGEDTFNASLWTVLLWSTGNIAPSSRSLRGNGNGGVCSTPVEYSSST